MSEKLFYEIQARYSSFMEELEQLCEENGLQVPTVIAVSKTKPIEAILAAKDIGIKHFGENYAKELKEKAEQIDGVVWHYIGHLQRRNAGLVSPYVSYIHSVDSKKLLDRLSHLCYKGQLFLQYNLSKEETKHGVKTVDELLTLKDYATSLGLNVNGLMVMGSISWKSETLIENFSRARQISENLFGANFTLSAGMSGDWREAVISGATHLRIGTAIFGHRG